VGVFCLEIQPLRALAYGMWMYAVPSEPTRESPNELTELEVDARIGASWT
jgi:hypothetical protein